MKELIHNLLPNLPWIAMIAISIIGGIGTFLFYNKMKGWLAVVGILIEAIEIVDKDIKDILPDNWMEKIRKIKQVVNSMLKPADKDLLDKLLKERGYKNG